MRALTVEYVHASVPEARYQCLTRGQDSNIARAVQTVLPVAAQVGAVGTQHLQQQEQEPRQK